MNPYGTVRHTHGQDALGRTHSRPKTFAKQIAKTFALKTGGGYWLTDMYM